MKIALWLAGFLSTVALHAQTTAFTYQGKLNANGSAANGLYDLRFTIYDAVTNGNAVSFAQTNFAVNVNGGLFTTQLDFGANVFNGNPRWLDIGVRTNGSGLYISLHPRQPLTSAPYAIQAANAASAASAATANSVPAANLSGTIPLAKLPPMVVTNGASGVNFSGVFAGNGAGMTNVSVPLSAVNSGGAILWMGDFQLASTAYTGNTPVAVAAAEVNGDGKVDLISVNVADNTLSVLLNREGNYFELVASPGVGQFPTSVAAADVNGDGKTDLISNSRNEHTLTVLTNNGSGSFAVRATPGTGLQPIAVTTADVNGDGKVDLITANHGADTLTILTNHSAGSFTISSSPAVGDQPASVTAADLNGDNKIDLVCPNAGSGTLTILTNNGSGGFAVSASPVSGTTPQSVVATDMNDDGKVDLISANYGGNSLAILTNNGSGGFFFASSVNLILPPARLVAADVNSDGRKDLIIASGVNAPYLQIVLNSGGVGETGVWVSLLVGNDPLNLAAADINGDGQTDLISANAADHTLSILINQATFNGSFSGNGSGLHSIPAWSLIGAILQDNLPPSASFSGAVTATAFFGDGASVTNVQATNLAGNIPTTALGNAWKINGNTGANPASGAFLGTADDLPLELKVNGQRALRLQPNTVAPSLVGGNSNNLIDPGIHGSTIGGGGGGGQPNVITNTATHSVIGGGKGNTIGGASLGAGIASVIGGGDRNTVSGQIATVGGGQFNSAGANYATIPGGANNAVAAGATYGFAAGQRAKANHSGTFVWADAQGADFASTAANQFLIRAAGGVGINTNNPQAALHVGGTIIANGMLGVGTVPSLWPLDVNGSVHVGDYGASGSAKLIRFGDGDFVFIGENTEDDRMELRASKFSFLAGNVAIGFTSQNATEKLHVDGNILATGTVTGSSDRNVKENFTFLDSRAVLEKVAALPISRWNYTNSPAVPHIGPMAQDFHAAFGVGRDEKTISMVDADGVALAAIQGLNQKVEDKDAKIQSLEKRLAELEALVKKLSENK